ncbi:hypothetical protein FRC04_011347 [Tulasnella sp. 424]|nr:hypothetical protein FRC04_011347 [Tulasnella sp. 424]KAG8975484.1 hypothetical protein FRC05_005553 [Tulasnella sp. 425]
MPSSISLASAALNPIEVVGVSGDPLISPSLAQSGTNVNASEPNSVLTNTHQDSSSYPPAVHFALPPQSALPLNTQEVPHPDTASAATPALLPPPPFDDPSLNAAVTTTLPQSAPSSLPSTPAPSEMFLFDTSPEHVEIVIPGDNIILRGVGQNVEPTVFSGQVVLRLSEATNIKEIILNFSGKSKLPSVDSRAPTVSVGTSSIMYKLRATVIRSSFSSNWVTQRPVTIVRGFSPEALEYNQTLEIENTWPQKIMYSVMIPHKAFAAGDEIPVSLKFTPLTKGVAVMNIETAIKQYLSIRARGALPFQDARVVAKTTHFIRNGQPVEARAGRRTSPTLWDVSTAYVRTTAIMTPPMQVEPDHLPRDASPPSSSGRGSSEVAVDDDPERGDNELDTCIKFRIPAWTTPSNLTEPIVINYKLKWSITLSNLDGHTSELRCALPLHILSHSLLDEARAASLQTRAILFGGEDVEPTQTILPSYASHIQDRIANALDLVGHTRLAPNPLHNLDPVLASSNGGGASGSLPAPSRSHASSSAGPSTPGEEAAELVDTGLLLSLGLRNTAAAFNSSVTGSPLTRSETTPPDSRRSSFRTGSRVGAGGSSRTSSRATSPEPPESAELPGPSSSLGSGNGNAPSGSKSFFSLKPFTNLANKLASANSKSMSQIHHPATTAGNGTPGSNPTSPKLLSRALGSRSRPPSNSNLRAEFAAAAPVPATAPAPNQLEMLSDLLSRVPNYERASQGFLGGGVPPLDTYAGLPTYNEVESVSRVRSDGALLRGRAATADGHVYDHDSEAGASSSAANAASRPANSTRPPVTATGEPRQRQASFTLDP